MTEAPPRPAQVLTPREVEVLDHISRGHSNGSTGRALGLTEDTVKSHAQRAYRKLGVCDRAHAVAMAYQRGILPAEDPKPPPALPLVVDVRPGAHSFVTRSGDKVAVLGVNDRDADLFARALWGGQVQDVQRVRVLDALRRVVGA